MFCVGATVKAGVPRSSEVAVTMITVRLVESYGGQQHRDYAGKWLVSSCRQIEVEGRNMRTADSKGGELRLLESGK